ncbi:Inner membrane protein required for assembly of the F0 sector of ATP synthase [Handroanthus impetiginosus]|uniref:Inner membrane protein required for assembly of the F0 sector of ATP synthase n=1 Tax=Handroanthus impetiginosus TaxID=429701 RepID=A0A2G9GFE9_9LAMI|nr:Inner membrane protein required for assembly of the F0 sector of ATP synthase [Handroanthus impetiginosus]
MLRFRRLLSVAPRNVNSISSLKGEEKLFPVIPLQNPSQWTSTRFLDIYQMGNKEAIEKERARLKDEMNRGYFADISEMKQHGGKISVANKIIIPAMAALKFPTFEANYTDGASLKLPVASDASKSDVPKATLLCLSFRASSQPMVNSWSTPFLNAFGHSNDVRLYEVSFIDSWLLTRSPIKKLLLKIMRKPKPEEKQNALQRRIVYSFGDHYYFRKELKILNLLTGYIFLLDKLGRIRWQGSGLATQDELSSLISCTSLLLEEK